MLYKFEKYNKRNKYNCPKCGHKKVFKRYIDSSNSIIDVSVGRCDRENNCGYNYTPQQFYKDNGIKPVIKQEKYKEPERPDFIDYSLVKELMFIPEITKENLTSFILKSFKDKESVLKSFEKYMIGTTDFFNQKSIIFWQIDTSFNVRFGKVMPYTSNSKRLKKNNKGVVTSIHNILCDKKQLREDYLTSYCFFGCHLLVKEDKPVAIVESEKTALFLSILKPQYTWIATGSLTCLSYQNARFLKGKDVVLFPDFGAGLKKWNEKINTILKFAKSCKISEYILQNDTENNSGKDILDLLI